jgi:hypothetical protein|tara:strand:+ start:24 stop:962 length:939 start_codon:yes stop_codon:yes gene_type:complete
MLHKLNIMKKHILFYLFIFLSIAGIGQTEYSDSSNCNGKLKSDMILNGNKLWILCDSVWENVDLLNYNGDNEDLRFQFYEKYGEPFLVKAKGNVNQHPQKGLWKYYYTNGHLHSEGNYTDKGNKIGLWKYYNDDSLTYIEGRMKGFYKEINEFEDIYGDNVFYSEWVKTYDSDSIWQFNQNYNNSMEECRAEVYWKEGKQYSIWKTGSSGEYYYFIGKGDFISYKQEGPWKYFTNRFGQLTQDQLNNDNKDLYLAGSYKNGKWQGLWQFIDDDGVSYEGIYEDDRWISGVDIRKPFHDAHRGTPTINGYFDD